MSISNKYTPERLLKKRFTFILIVLFIFGKSTLSLAQNIDSSVVKHSPKKAAIMSAALPGLGQIYNKKYWKLPIIYAGVATITYFAVFNSKNYNKYKTAYRYRTDNNQATIDDYVGKYTDQNLIDLKDFYRRNLELTVVAGIAVYALNIIDANVDAHLYDFEINDNLSIKINPELIVNNYKPSLGVGFCLKLKSSKQ